MNRILHEWQPDLAPVERFQALLPLVAAADLAAYDLAPDSVIRTGTRILRLLTMCITGRRAHRTIAADLARAWCPEQPQAARLLNAALIMCADHELNVSSFTARCVASAGSTPYAVVMAGLAALQGPRHGGHTLRAEALYRDAAVDARMAVSDRLRQGATIAGFGHPLYPDGDPRGRFLIGLARDIFPDSGAISILTALLGEVQTSTQKLPNIDFGLVAIARTLGLPAGAPFTLFALGRIAGWIGQAIEQYETGQMIRPRARYVGVTPGSQP